MSDLYRAGGNALMVVVAAQKERARKLPFGSIM